MQKGKVMPEPRNGHSRRSTILHILSLGEYTWHWNGGTDSQATTLSPQKGHRKYVNHENQPRKLEKIRNYRGDSKYIYPPLCNVHCKKRPLLHRGVELERCPFSKGKKVTQRRLFFSFFTFFQKQNRVNKCILLNINWKGEVCFFTACRADGVQRSP